MKTKTAVCWMEHFDVGKMHVSLRWWRGGTTAWNSIVDLRSGFVDLNIGRLEIMVLWS